MGAALPYAGDLAKGPKIAKGLDKINDAIEATEKSTDLAKEEPKTVKNDTTKVLYYGGKNDALQKTEKSVNGKIVKVE